MEEEITHICNVCSCEFTDDEGGIDGYFGILPVHFCPTCFSSMCDMASQYLSPEDLQQLDTEQQEFFEALKGVRHIVINNCHGGFGLSWDAQIAYLDRAGIAYTLGDRESRDDTIRFGQEIKLSNGDTFSTESLLPPQMYLPPRTKLLLKPTHFTNLLNNIIKTIQHILSLVFLHKIV
jgi:hypothetical protein